MYEAPAHFIGSRRGFLFVFDVFVRAIVTYREGVLRVETSPYARTIGSSRKARIWMRISLAFEI